jgi:hypothetical protein
MDQQALQLCKDNFARNGIPTSQQESTTAAVECLLWGNKTQIQHLLKKYHQFDAIVGADIVYPSTCGETLQQLFVAVDCLLCLHGTFWLSFATRDGCKTPSRLLEAASDAGYAIDCLPALDPSITRRLPPLLDSKVLVLKRDKNAARINGALGGNDCPIFPGLRAALARLDDPSSEEEWEPPFAEE